MPVALHNIVIPAHLSTRGRMTFTIDNKLNAQGVHEYRFVSHRMGALDGPAAPIMVAGSGGAHLLARGHGFFRDLLNLVRANDRGSLSDIALADYFAGLNLMVHRDLLDGTVGPRCVVVWRRVGDNRGLSGGGQQFYSGVERDVNGGGIPTIANGMDVRALFSVLAAVHFPEIERAFAAREEPRFDHDEMNRRIAMIPHEPDDRLR